MMNNNFFGTPFYEKKMEITKDIYYDIHTNRCDIYHSKNSTHLQPTVIVIHGGAWIFGCKEEMNEICQFLTSKGYVSVAIEYALSQLDKTFIQTMMVSGLLCILVMCLFVKSKSLRIAFIFLSLFMIVYSILNMLCHENRMTQHPDHVKDVAKAIQWVFTNIEQYGGNKDQICLLGHSSGAHLASLVTLNTRFLKDVGLENGIIKGVVAISGPYSYWRIQESSVKHFINQTVFAQHHCIDPKTLNNISKEEYQIWAKIVDAWPIFFEHTISAKTTPPFLLLTAGVDGSLLYHARDFADIFKRQKGHVQVIHFPNTTHFSIRAHWEKQNKDVGDVVHQFLHVIYHFSGSKY